MAAASTTAKLPPKRGDANYSMPCKFSSLSKRGASFHVTSRSTLHACAARYRFHINLYSPCRNDPTLTPSRFCPEKHGYIISPKQWERLYGQARETIITSGFDKKR